MIVITSYMLEVFQILKLFISNCYIIMMYSDYKIGIYMYLPVFTFMNLCTNAPPKIQGNFYARAAY
jgi:hypothetical protein